MPVSVRPGSAPADLATLEASEKIRSQEAPEAELSGLASGPGATAASLIPVQHRAWFPFVQAAPAVGFLALWGWDRRRRYLEAHPDVVRRNRAGRALRRVRRAMAQAARKQDAPAFASAAIDALRIACAPTSMKHLSFITIALLLFLSACSPSAVATSAGEQPSLAQVTEPAVSSNTQPLAVQNVEVAVGIGSPLRVDIVVSGIWPSLCSQVAEVRSSVRDFNIDITVLASMQEA